MELRVFDETVEPLGLIDEMASLLWHVKYFDVGTFNLLAPITDNNKRLLTEGNIIVKHDGKREVTDAAGGIWRRAAQITYVHITKDENGLEQIEAQGYMLSQWLNKRCISPQIVATATNQSIINTMVKNNCGSGASTKRRFPRFIMLAQETMAGSAVEYANEVYAKLGQEVKARAQAGKLGYDILINTYLQMLKTRAAAELENYGKIINFVSTINTNSNLKFKQDFDLGDRITCKETKWGIQIDARITEVTETYQKGAEEIEATFGDSLPTLVDQIRKVR